MFKRLLEEIATALDRRGIRYMVIGGQAVLLYGEPRLTRDIDVTLGADPGRLPEILEVVRDSGWQVMVESPADFVSRTMVLPCKDAESGIRMDFVFSFSPYEQQALGRVRRVPLGRTEVRYVSPEDLIIHKIVAGRPRDLEDVRSILLKHGDLDLAYIRGWLADFAKSLGGDCSVRFQSLLKSIHPEKAGG